MSRTTTQHHDTGRLELEGIADRVEIAAGVMMPRLGVGTSHVVGRTAVEREIGQALDMGYRSIDTATAYGNEHEIGEVLAAAGVPRDELFVTSKVWPSDQGYEPTLHAFERSRSDLGLDYLDLYLIHWPKERLIADTWRALEELLDRRVVRAIGVSNFMRQDLEQLFQTARIVPAVNQIEYHPRLQRDELVAYCRSYGMTIEAWSPLMRGGVLHIPELQRIGERHDKTAAQVTLRWILQKDIVTIPKASSEQHLRENAALFDFELTAEEMATIDGLDRGEHVG